MLWIIVFLRALRPNDLCSAKNNTRLVGGHSSFKASHHMVHQKQIKYSTLIQYNLSNKTDEYVTKITKNRSTVSDQKLKSLSMICGHGYTGLWPSWRPWWYLKGAPIWTRAPDWPSLWSLWMTVCHPMQAVSCLGFVQSHNWKRPLSVCIWMGKHQDQLGDGLLTLTLTRLKFFRSCHLWKMHREHNGKTYLVFWLIL